MPDIHNLGKGAKRQPQDLRDRLAAFLIAGATPVDWSVPFRLPQPPVKNQGQSDSCVAHSTSYLHWQLKRKDYSRRDLFSRIALSEGGAYLRDGVKTICLVGQQTYDECIDPAYQTEANMREKSTTNTGGDDLEAGYYLANPSIEVIAQTIRDKGGCVFGVEGDDRGWRNIAYPLPPVYPEWAHALYGFGYQMENGKRYIIAASSWDSTGGTTIHHIPESYFNTGHVFDNWILVPRKDTHVVNRYLVNKNGKLGVCVSVDGDGIFTDTVFWAKSMEHLEQMKVQYEIPADAKVITYPM